jgi:hypothetical protein
MRYAACYCEENVWHLSVDPAVSGEPRRVVFISNAARRCPLWAQRAGNDVDGFVVWDYHVILITRVDDCWQVWDLDTTLGMPVALSAYLAATWPMQVQPAFAPLFKLVPAAAFRRDFCSDRSHMRTADGWLAPPPDWPCIGDGDCNLQHYIDTADTTAGDVLTLAQLYAIA